MNLKKFISGVSALTIAASAFAGLAVTANAADQSITGSYSTTDHTFGWTIDGLDAHATSSGSSDPNYSATATNSEDATDSVGMKVSLSRYRNTNTNGRDSLLSSGEVYVSQASLKNDSNVTDGIYSIGISGGRYFLISPTKDGTFTCDVRTNLAYGTKNRSYTEDFYVNEAVTSEDGTKYVINTKTATKATSIATTSDGTGNQPDSSKINYHMDGGKSYVITTFISNGTNFETWFSNFKYTDDKVPTAIAITGSSTVVIGSSEQYSAMVVDQYGNQYNTDATIEVSASAATGISYSNGTLTADSSAVAGSTVTLTATATVNGTAVEGEKTVNVSNLAGFVLNTTPYSLLYVDGGEAINTGRTGAYTFGTDQTGSHTVTIEKSGYVTKSNVEINVANNDSISLMLDAQDGIVYYEDFANVNDDFGSTDSAVTVTGNKLTYVCGDETKSNNYYNSTKTSYINLPNSIDVTNKVITLEITSTVNANTRNGINFEGVTYTRNSSQSTINAVHNTSSNNQWRVCGTSSYSDAITNGTPHTLQIFLARTDNTEGFTNGHARYYLDGKYIGVQGVTYVTDAWSGFAFYANGNNTNKSVIGNKIEIDSIKVSDKPVDFVITAYDAGNTTATSATYLTGSTASLVLPQATGEDGIFKGWSADGGETLVNAGETVTATSETEYVAVYEQILPPTAVATLVEDKITDDEGYTGEDADPDAVYSVFKATVTAGTNAISNVYFTLNDGAMRTDEYKETIFTSTNAIFGLVVPMVASAVEDIKAVLNGASYDAYVK